MALNDALKKIEGMAAQANATEEQQHEREKRLDLESKAMELEATKLVEEFFRPIFKDIFARFKGASLDPHWADKQQHQHYRQAHAGESKHREFFSLSFSLPRAEKDHSGRIAATITVAHPCGSPRVGMVIEVHEGSQRAFTMHMPFSEATKQSAEALVEAALNRIT